VILLVVFCDLESVIEKVTLKNQLFDGQFLGLIIYDFPWFSTAVLYRFYSCCRISNRIAEKTHLINIRPLMKPFEIIGHLRNQADRG